jgi:hypothetical protein
MLFIGLLKALSKEVGHAVDELFAVAEAKQTHPQDLLLVDQHGFYDSALAEQVSQGNKRISPYFLGRNEAGFAEDCFYRFIDWYRKSHREKLPDFNERVKLNKGTQETEQLFLQVEQSIYLRFWESDYILKQLLQLSLLAQGKPYDWHLQIPANPREGSRQELVRTQIRDPLKGVCPAFYHLVKECYRSQLRNAIAHSQFYFLNRQMHLLNYSPDPKCHAPCKGVSFDEWYSLFHRTILLHNELIGRFARSRKAYRQKTLESGNRIPIRLTSPGKGVVIKDVGVMHNRDQWIWFENLNREDLEQRRTMR